MAISPIEKTGGRQIYKVDAVRLYETTNRHIGAVSNENPFKGTVQWGLFSWNYSDPGQLDGNPSQTYDRDGNPHEIHTICWA